MVGNKSLSVKELKDISRRIRRHIVRMIYEAKSGHPGGALGLADIFTHLYYRELKHNPKKPNWSERDYFFLSNGHVCPGLYSVLSEIGYFPKSELIKLRKLGALLQGHPHNNIPGVENSSGPLGQGVSVAAGCALALQADGKKNKVFAMCGDGELDEGEVWEALMLAANYSLENFTLIVDANGIQLDGNTDDVMKKGHLASRFRSFGLSVFACDGHDFIDLHKTFSKAINSKSPSVIIARTIPGKGVSFMENKYQWHGKAPSKEELDMALGELDE